MQVRDIMSSPAVTAAPDMSIHDAIGRMLEQEVGSVVVVDAGVVGMLTRSDVLRVAYHQKAPLTALSVREGMSTDVKSISPGRTVQTALDTMKQYDIKKLPVLDGIDLVGIVTMHDIGAHRPREARAVRESNKRRDGWN